MVLSITHTQLLVCRNVTPIEYICAGTRHSRQYMCQNVTLVQYMGQNVTLDNTTTVKISHIMNNAHSKTFKEPVHDM